MSNPKKQRLIIIDGNALIHRSFHALPPTIATKKGEMTNAVYGFTTVLIKAIREFKPEFVVLTLDKKGQTFRHKEYKEYKAKRVKAPDDLYKQIPRVKEIARAFNIPIFEITGLEADDLIGAIANTVDDKVEKIIVTGDMDTLQLVNNHTKVYTMSRGLSDSVMYDKTAVKNRYGLTPEQMVDYKALRGDPSDNIPGVRGIGEKIAVELLQNFKTLKEVYRKLEARSKKLEKVAKPRTVELLKEHKKDAFMSKKLATIKRDADIDFELEKTRFGDFDKRKVVELFSELEFKSLLPRIQDLSLKQESNKTLKQRDVLNKFERNKKLFKYYLADNEKKFKKFLAKLKKQKEFAFDTETSSFDPITAELLGISFSWNRKEAWYVEVRSKRREVTCLSARQENEGNNLFNYKKLDNDKANSEFYPWLKELKPIFTNKKIKKSGHNVKFDIRVMKNNGVEVNGVEFDTMVASYLLNPGTRAHNLDAVTFSELGHEKITKEYLLGRGRDKTAFSEVETEKLYIYSCEDADFTFRLTQKLSKQLKEQKLDKLFREVEMPLVQILAQMEDNGIIVDAKFLSKMNRLVSSKIKTLEKNIYKQANLNFNINSTQQLRAILFEKLQIPTQGISKTKTGFSTAADELEKLKDLHPIIKLIQEYRELAKLANTYINALPKLVNKKTGRVHTSFNQTVTATGRLSSSEPNLQNIPIRTELGRKIRKAFVAERGFKLVSLDYSQIELRLAAHMSGDKKMIKAFKEGVDIHSSTAAEIHGVKLEEVTRAMRREAKAINFGILYGQGPHGLSQVADIPYVKAKEFIEQYFNAYKDIKEFIDALIEKTKKNGYAETLYGRRRYLPEINSSVVMVKKAAERMAVNMPLQGTAADMIKMAMIIIARMLIPHHRPLSLVRRGEEDVRMLLQAHDELLFEIKNDKVEEIAGKIKDIMEGVLKLKVPVVVDVGVGENWGNLTADYADI